MDNKYKRLVQERADLVAEQKGIFEAAEKDKRDLTEADKQRDDEIAARMEVIAQDLAREARRREFERSVTPLVVPDAARVELVPDEQHPFKSLGEQLGAVIRAKQAPAYADPRLEKYNRMLAATGMFEGGLAEGGAFVQTDFSNTLIERTYATGQILQRIPEQPISPTANAYSALLIKETSRATGSRYGGLRVYRVGEGGTISPSRPEFDRKEIKPAKLAALCYLTDELVQDATALEGHVRRLFPLEAAFLMEDELFNGTGAGQSMGVLNATATVSVAKEAGQGAATILAKNLSKMWSRCWAPARANAAWYYHQDCEAELDGLYVPVGVGGLKPDNIITYGPNGELRIKGRPAIPVEYCQTLGTVGDIVLADFGQYLGVSKGSLRIDASLSVAFVTDELALRFVWRYTAEPIWRAPLTPARGSNTLSPFITLATRA